MTKWEYKKINKDKISKISKELNVSPLSAMILSSKNIKMNEIKEFLNPNVSIFHDPFLMKNMKNVVSKINEAISTNKKIMIYGDYDVDGITSISILYKYLNTKTNNISYYIPDRVNEGYGLAKNTLENMHKDGVEFIITVDTGISAIEEIKYAINLGMEIVVTDHHESFESLDDICYSINPKQSGCKYPFKDMPGVGIVFKLIVAMEGINKLDELIASYSEFLCLGCISDICPLVDENRYFVNKGLEKINNKNENIGLKKLIELSTKKEEIDAKTIGYVLAPRINAAGRLGNACRSLELFLTNDENKAKEIAEFLCEENVKRQEIEKETYEEALIYLKEHSETNDDKILVIAKENWHQGVIGIVSSKITEKFEKPCIMFTIKNGEAKGSGRSANNIDIYKIVESQKDMLNNFGGHEFAIGISIDSSKIKLFKNKINELLKNNYDTKETEKIIEIDACVKPSFFTLNTYKEIQKFQPFGMSNQEPIFALKNAIVEKIKEISNGRHILCTVKKENTTIEAIGFGMGKKYKDILYYGSEIDIAFNLNTTEKLGRTILQMLIKDIKSSNENTKNNNL